MSRCGFYTRTRISKICGGAPYIDFLEFLYRSTECPSGDGEMGEEGEEKEKEKDRLSIWRETLRKLNFAPGHIDIKCRPIPAIVYKNKDNKLFIDILLHNTTNQQDLYKEGKLADVVVTKIPYPNCLCDLCIRRFLFSKPRTPNHWQRMLLLDGEVYWLQESGINLKRMLMSCDRKVCCVNTYAGYPYYMYPQTRCVYSGSGQELYRLVWFDWLPDDTYFVNPSILCNGPAAWHQGIVYLVTTNCVKYKVDGGIPPMLLNVLLTFDDLEEIWVVVVKDGLKLSIYLIYFSGFVYLMDLVYFSDNFFSI